MVTLQDIATRVGVSHAVVSCVLNNRLGKIRVSEARRLEILKVAEEMGYVPNRSAQNLAARRNKALGLIVNFPRYSTQDAFGSAYILSILNGMHAACDPIGYHCLYTLADTQNPAAFEVPAFVRERSVDGIVLAGYIHPKIEDQLLKTGMPIWHLGANTAPDSKLPRIYADMGGIACQALDRAVNAGLKSIELHMASGPGPDIIVAAFRAHARDYYPDLPIVATQCSSSNFTAESIRELGRRVAASGIPPELLIVPAYAVSQLHLGLTQGGLNCPDDIQLAFFAGDGLHDYRLGPDLLSLSLLYVPICEVSRHLTLYLLKQLEEDQAARISQDAPPFSAAIPCSFISGETAPALTDRSNSPASSLFANPQHHLSPPSL